MISCPLCSAAEIKSFSAIPHDVAGYKSLLSVKQCLNCELAWQYPRYRTADESISFHQDKYAEQEKGSYYDPEKRCSIVATELSFVETLFDAPGSLLDIGAGDGTFIVQAANRGWRCIGVDPAASQDAHLPMSGTGTCRLIKGTLGDLDPTQRFDAVTFWDVIEHLDDPENVLRAAVRFLKEDGVLVIETGNYQSVDRIMSGADWWAYAADHRWYFAPPTVRRLLLRVGLGHVALGAKVLRPWWRGKHSYGGPSLLRTLKRLVRSPLSAVKTIGQYTLLKKAAVDWEQWAGLGIIAVAASRHPMRDLKCGTELIALA
jgi:2-polyprenyl-3-methyl-5-hydroxy-6-metoxy-1,4-benzoquinol methylase